MSLQGIPNGLQPEVADAAQLAFRTVCDHLGCGTDFTVVKAALLLHLILYADRGDRDPDAMALEALAALGCKMHDGEAAPIKADAA